MLFQRLPLLVRHLAMSLLMSNSSILYDCLFLSRQVFFYLPPVVQSAQGPKQKRHCLFNQGQQCITVSFHWYSTLLAVLHTTVYTSGYSVFAGTITVWQMAHQGHLSEAGRQESYKEGGHLSPCMLSLGCHASVSMTTRKPLNLQWEMATQQQLWKLAFDTLLLLVHPYQKHTHHSQGCAHSRPHFPGHTVEGANDSCNGKDLLPDLIWGSRAWPNMRAR